MRGERHGHDVLFYDGYCALCHAWVRRVSRHDAEGRLFRFAPLFGETFGRMFDERQRQSMPDSIVVVTSGGEVLAQSAAVRRIVDRLGRPAWLFLLTLPMRLPAPVADAIYAVVARVRYRVWGRSQQGVCPRPDPEMRARFLP